MIRLNHHGDTIVEVLIALAVTSALITGALTTSNRSLRGALQSQQRGEALKLVESQAEALRIFGATKIGYSPGPATPFCLNVATPSAPVVNGGPDPIVLSAAADPLTAYPAACTGGSGNNYHLVIYRPAGDSHVFSIYARWPSFGGSINDELVIRYVVY